MKRSIRMISLLLAIFLLVGAFSGCGGDSKDKDGTSAQKGVLLKEPVTFSLLTYEHSSQPWNTDAVKFKALTEATNVTLDINVCSIEDAKTKYTATLASGKMYDITYLDFKYVQQYSKSLFLDLTDYMKNGSLSNYMRWVKEDEHLDRMAFDGHHYAFATVNAVNYPLKTEVLNGLFPVMRTDLLEENNIAVPTTWDEWFVAMKKLKTAYPNSTPWGGRAVRYIYSNMEYMLGCQSDINYDYSKNKYIIGALEPEYKSILEFEKRCYDEGILDPDFQNATSNSWNEGVNSNNIFFWIDNDGFATAQTLALKQSSPNAKMEVIPLMENSSGEKRALKYGDITHKEVYVLSANTGKDEQLVKFMDWCYSDQGMYINNYGKEGETFTVNKDGSVKLAENILTEYSGATSNYAWMSDYGLGMLAFAPLSRTGDGVLSFVNPEATSNASEVLSSDSANIKPRVDFEPTISDDITTKASLINNYIYQRIPKFISGELPMTQWDAFVDQIKSMGAEEVLAAYNK